MALHKAAQMLLVSRQGANESKDLEQVVQVLGLALSAKQKTAQGARQRGTIHVRCTCASLVLVVSLINMASRLHCG